MYYKFKTDTELAGDFVRLLTILKDKLELNTPLKMFVAGGMAVHLSKSP